MLTYPKTVSAAAGTMIPEVRMKVVISPVASFHGMFFPVEAVLPSKVTFYCHQWIAIQKIIFISSTVATLGVIVPFQWW